jgi:CheY-like chemotaxis protein
MTHAMHRVLVIEDDPAQRRVLSILFETNGFRVVAADTCELAIRQARSHRPDVCVAEFNAVPLEGQG